MEGRKEVRGELKTVTNQLLELRLSLRYQKDSLMRRGFERCVGFVMDLDMVGIIVQRRNQAKDVRDVVLWVIGCFLARSAHILQCNGRQHGYHSRPWQGWRQGSCEWRVRPAIPVFFDIR